MPPWGSKLTILLLDLIVILGFLFGSISGPAAVSTPSIQLPVMDFNYGEVEEGTIVSYDFQIRNTGSGVLEIHDVRPG
jgi:hypothetical protein